MPAMSRCRQGFSMRKMAEFKRHVLPAGGAPTRVQRFDDQMPDVGGSGLQSPEIIRQTDQ